MFSNNNKKLDSWEKDFEMKRNIAFLYSVLHWIIFQKFVTLCTFIFIKKRLNSWPMQLLPVKFVIIFVYIVFVYSNFDYFMFLVFFCNEKTKLNTRNKKIGRTIIYSLRQLSWHTCSDMTTAVIMYPYNHKDLNPEYISK